MRTPPGGMTALDTLLWNSALEHAPSLSLGEALAHAYPEDPPDQLTVWTLSADVDNPLERLARRGAALGAIVERLGPISLLWIPDGRGAFVAGLWPTRHEGIYHLVGTVPVTDPRWRRLERWVINASPRVFVPFLTEVEFESILRSLQKLGPIEVSRVTARTIDYYSSIMRGWRAGHVRPTPMAALATVRDADASPRTITLEVIGQLAMHLRRDSGATFYSGDFSAFEDIVMTGFAQAAQSRRSLLSGRQRHDPRSPLRPIRIKLATKAFDETDILREIVETLSSPELSVAVLHRNPYVHMAITDYVDGSNVDAFVFTGDEMVVYPGYAASAGALARMTSRVTDRFAGVEVSEAPPIRPPTREDLMTNG
jgi:hypothetical protein